ncbi:MAG: TIGR01841 family phasin [Paracoccaceae bacterium]
MFSTTAFPFDPAKIEEFFKTGDFTKTFFGAQMPKFDTEALLAAQKKNMDALVAANKAAAAGYQDLFERQVALFEETMTETQKQIASLAADDLTPESASARGEIAKAAFEKALANMRELAELAQKANSEAYRVVSARIKDQVEELKEMAEKNLSA